MVEDQVKKMIDKANEELLEKWYAEQSKEEETLINFSKENTNSFENTVALFPEEKGCHKWASWSCKGWVGEGKGVKLENVVDDIIHHIKEGQPSL